MKLPVGREWRRSALQRITAVPRRRLFLEPQPLHLRLNRLDEPLSVTATSLQPSMPQATLILTGVPWPRRTSTTKDGAVVGSGAPPLPTHVQFCESRRATAAAAAATAAAAEAAAELALTHGGFLDEGDEGDDGSDIAKKSVTIDDGGKAAAAFASGVRIEESVAAAAPAEAAPAEAPAEPAPPPDAEELPTDAQLALALRAVYARHRHDRTLTWRTLVQKTETELGSVGLSTRRHIIKTTIELIKHEEAEAKAARASHAADDDEPPVVMFHALGGSPVGADAADEQAAADRAPPPRPRAGSDIAETSVTVDDGAEAAAAFVSGVRVKRRGSASPAKASADPPPSPPPPAPASTSSGRGLSSSSGNTTPVARSAARARQQREEERQHKPTLIMDLAR